MCNGQGGKICCMGCPAFNNRVMYQGGRGSSNYNGDSKPLKSASTSRLSELEKTGVVGGSEVDGEETSPQPDSEVTAMECFNCQTSTSLFISPFVM